MSGSIEAASAEPLAGVRRGARRAARSRALRRTVRPRPAVINIQEYHVSQTSTLSPDDCQEDIAPDRRPWLVRRGLLLESGPQRRLALGGFINQLGTAAFLATAPLYALRVVGLPIEQVGLGLGVAGVVGLLAARPSGTSPTAAALTASSWSPC